MKKLLTLFLFGVACFVMNAALPTTLNTNQFNKAGPLSITNAAKLTNTFFFGNGSPPLTMTNAATSSTNLYLGRTFWNHIYNHNGVQGYQVLVDANNYTFVGTGGIPLFGIGLSPAQVQAVSFNPITDAAYSLGTNGSGWRSLYVGGSAEPPVSTANSFTLHSSAIGVPRISTNGSAYFDMLSAGGGGGISGTITAGRLVLGHDATTVTNDTALFSLFTGGANRLTGDANGVTNNAPFLINNATMNFIGGAGASIAAGGGADNLSINAATFDSPSGFLTAVSPDNGVVEASYGGNPHVSIKGNGTEAFTFGRNAGGTNGMFPARLVRTTIGEFTNQVGEIYVTNGHFGGITNTGGFQIGADVNLFRSAANVLKTDDTFHAAGSILSGDGTAAAPGISFISQPALGLRRITTSTIGIYTSGSFLAWGLNNSGITNFLSTVVQGNLTVLGLFSHGGITRVSTQFNKTTDTTLANVTGLTSTLVAASNYTFSAHLFVDANVTGGSKFAIGGTATATAIIYRITLNDDTSHAETIGSRETAMAGEAGQAGTTVGLCTIKGTITVANAGTITVQFAQTVSSGTSSILAGSTFEVEGIQY